MKTNSALINRPLFRRSSARKRRGITLLFVGLIAPLLARSANNDGEEFLTLLSGGLGAALVGAIGIALGLSALAEEIVTILAGPAFAGSADILRLLGFLFVLHTMSLLLREAAVALDVQGRLVPVYTIGVIVAFAAYFLLIPTLAGLGAPLALVLAESTVLAGIFLVVTQRTRRRPTLGMLVGATFSGVLAAGVLFLAYSLDWGWLARVGCVVVAYLTVLFLTRTISPSELVSFVRGMRGGGEKN